MPGNRLPWKNFRMETRENAKKGKTQREMNRWSKTEHDKPWTDRRGRILETETDDELSFGLRETTVEWTSP
jgi:hypothetical protein